MNSCNPIHHVRVILIQTNLTRGSTPTTLKRSVRGFSMKMDSDSLSALRVAAEPRP